MIVTKDINFITFLKMRGKYMVWLLAFMGVIATLYYFKIITINIPWLPVSVIGTAVAFFVGFKNNQSDNPVKNPIIPNSILFFIFNSP